MSAKALTQLINKTIELEDKRTGAQYRATIEDARTSYGVTQILIVWTLDQATEVSTKWFEPTTAELASVAK